jgi:hypothetical protein
MRSALVIPPTRIWWLLTPQIRLRLRQVTCFVVVGSVNGGQLGALAKASAVKSKTRAALIGKAKERILVILQRSALIGAR